MTSRPLSVGFLLPADDRLVGGEATITSIDGYTMLADEVIPEWDYFKNLTVQWPFAVDLAGFLNDCSLTSRARLRGVLAWQASGTGMRGAGPVVAITDGENLVAADIPGHELGGALHLRLRIVLAETDPGAGPLAPRRPGSILWQDAASVVLEGSGSRFPVVQTSFASSGIADGRPAMWYLSCGTDLDSSDTGSIRLYLNTDHQAITSLLNSPDGERSRVLADFMRYDAARQLVLHAIGHDDLDLDAGYEPGTLGDLLGNLLRRCFPSGTLNELRGDRESDPGEFEARIQAALGVVNG
ncbi:hypothetical protein GA0074696_5536 [Micromonospora purpureochromogenes]|uniref:Uncharacterized protein n=1 Tax=Micromonospora purpureochromogenes TaxID=47872 RepID=A0A1C5A8F4_9ACTN|nr:hypothetical protein [Micromonospora purpureochromogenes]SCF41449.1 hypothetical protein GA0074696_5536 [Micromonospora purpureochromogenes]